MLQWCLSLPNRCSHSEIVPTKSWCGMTAAGTVCLMRWFNGKRGLAHTSLGKTKVNTSLLLSCECATPAERFINHQLETAQGWFQHGGIKKRKKRQRKPSQPSKTLGIKEAISQSCNENQRDDFFFSAHLTTVELCASIALKRWQIQYQTTVLRQIKTRFATFWSPGSGKG